MSYFDEISAALAALSSADPEEIRQVLRQYDVRDVQAVTINEGGGNGGAQPGAVQLLRIPVAFNTPNILTGFVALTLAENDVLLTVGLALTTVFDGSSPRLFMHADPLDPAGSEIFGQNADSNPLTQLNSTNAWSIGGGTLNDPNGPIAIGGSAPLYILLDDNAGGNPGSTQGEGFWLAMVSRA